MTAHSAPTARRPLVAVLAHSVAATDPRVRRQARALAEAGYRTVVIARAAGGGVVEGAELAALPAPRRGAPARLARALEKLPARVSARLAVAITRASPANRAAMRALDRLRPEVLHANDWPTLPVASWLRSRHGAKVIYDSHEYAREERADSALWRITYAPHVRAVESACIGDADRVVTVSDGIARLIQASYGLARTPEVIRNVPEHQVQPYREPADPLVVLYHGLLNADRGLDALVASVREWREDRVLVLRGPGPEGYLARLRRTAGRLGVSGRVRFEPPVPASELIARANAADVGIHPIAPRTPQTNYCLPNKVFEYAMAGLCLCVTPAEEMARLVREHDLGAVAADASARAIAESVNGLTRERVARCKRNALAAAKALCWERERQRLLALYAELVGPAPAGEGGPRPCAASGPR